MLEEKNDNLHDADGENFKTLAESVTNLNVPEDGAVADNDDLDAVGTVRETEGQMLFMPQDDETVNDLAGNSQATEKDAEAGSQDNAIGEAFLQENDGAAQTGTQSAMEAIESSNAEASEHGTDAGNHHIPMKNYEALTMEELAAELETLAKEEKVMAVKEHIEEIRKEFYSKYNHFIEEKRDEYSHENNGDASGFEYHYPLKGRFDSLYNQYRDRRNSHFKKVQTDLQGNLEKRQAIIEELKSLINSDENIKDMLKQVNELRERWKNAGPIPRDKYNHVWNNFHFHIERFYDHLHLDREARDLDFKHNLEQKQKIITRVEELVNEEDVQKAFRELQGLHKMWKEEIGPVDREH